MVIYERMHVQEEVSGRKTRRAAYTRAPDIHNVAPFVCPVNYSRSKLSGNEVPGSSPGPSSHSPLPLFLLLSGYLTRLCPIPVGHPPVERKRTNKSARALRRDIVSCKVNHLRGSKTAPSPRLARPRGDVCYLVHAVSARYFLPRHRHFSLSLSLSLFRTTSHSSSRPRRPPRRILGTDESQSIQLASNMRTHSLVINVIGSLVSARAVAEARS